MERSCAYILPIVKAFLSVHYVESDTKLGYLKWYESTSCILAI